MRILRQFPPFLEPGSHGAAVRDMQIALKAFVASWATGEEVAAPVIPDGDFTIDGKTVRLVAWVQTMKLEVEGDAKLGQNSRASWRTKFRATVDFDTLPYTGPTTWVHDGVTREWTGWDADDPRHLCSSCSGRRDEHDAGRGCASFVDSEGEGKPAPEVPERVSHAAPPLSGPDIPASAVSVGGFSEAAVHEMGDTRRM